MTPGFEHWEIYTTQRCSLKLAKFSLVEVPKNWIFFQQLEAAAAEALLRRSEEKLPEFQTSQVGAAVSKKVTHLPSLKLTYPLKVDPWKRRFLLETIVFRGYVSFRECTRTWNLNMIPHPQKMDQMGKGFFLERPWILWRGPCFYFGDV